MSKVKIDTLLGAIKTEGNVFEGMQYIDYVPGNRNALFFSARKSQARLSNNRIVALFTLHNKIGAAEVYMSVSKFKYMFKAVTGQTFSDYIT